jgi:hypothetical protein
MILQEHIVVLFSRIVLEKLIVSQMSIVEPHNSLLCSGHYYMGPNLNHINLVHTLTSCI